jgi:uncharacterized membrane protein HdeD (DUF308 family)
MLLAAISSKWWIFLLNGLVAILFGIMAFVWPGITILSLVLLFGIYCIADGITAIGASFAKGDSGRSWWQMLLIGVISLVAGVTAIAWPGISAAVLLLVVAAWAIVRGIMEIVAAIELRKVLEHEWLLLLAGLASILFGIMLAAQPGLGAVVMIWWIGAFALVRGIFMVALSLRLRKLRPAFRAGGQFAAQH